MGRRPRLSASVSIARLLLCALLLLQSAPHALAAARAGRSNASTRPAATRALAPRVSPNACQAGACRVYLPLVRGSGAPVPADTTPPSPPAGLRSTGKTTTTLGLAWNAASDDVGVAGYILFAGPTAALTTTLTAATLTGLAPATTYALAVAAYDAAGNVSDRLPALAAATAAPPAPADITPPSAPANLRATGQTTTTIDLAWDAASDDVGVAGYAVYVGATRALSTTGTTATLLGLAPDTTYAISVGARDAAGNQSASAGPIDVTTAPGAPFEPSWRLDPPPNLRVTGLTRTSVGLAWEVPDGSVAPASYDIFQDGAWIGWSATTSYTATGLSPATAYSFTIQASDADGNYSAASAALATTAAPPDPAASAPPLAQTIASDIARDSAFLYGGDDPAQVGVSAGTILPQRAAILRGKVLTRDGGPLAGVRVSVLGHPELGATWTRLDGMFDMAVNGGGTLTVEYAKPGYLPAQRQVAAPWRDYALLPDVAMLAPDAAVTEIALGGDAPLQVAAGSPVSDADGSRRAVLVFPAGVAATAIFPDGGQWPMPTLHVRATEYTVGERGRAAMPGSLPANSGYTYAAEFGVDEAAQWGAAEVRFSQPVLAYVENFLGFPVGGAVPSGSYDRARAAWVASDNGRVIEIVGATDDLADLDLTGDGDADDPAALGIGDAERAMLAARYPVGQQLWRVPMICTCS